MTKRSKTSKRKYTKKAQAGVTNDMWILLQELKVQTRKSKAQILREAIQLYADHEAVSK